MDGSNHAGVAFGIDDLDALKAVLSSVPPEMAAQAESHGVIVPTIAAYVGDAPRNLAISVLRLAGRPHRRRPALPTLSES